ncbi:ATP-dependent DNA helicase [Thalassoroseus pseudoceratinae]|uniref:ATP-dependent DNA helicase n=1 Tax=Thalassoroseus pseudoceratinae TaxID=2713176 RepID=UPI0014206F4F|nr:ATP-dependent RecD-like DNA helicase [Thalassoroseus pseudoceratinae]
MKLPTLTAEQRDARDYLVDDPSLIRRLGGLAGTGKSTLLGYVAKEFPRALAMTPTGKAAEVLRQKGLKNATTIHSAIYACHEKPILDENGKEVKGKNGKPLTETIFGRKPPKFVEGDIFIVDEASMVTRKLYDDLRSYRRPIIFVGDHGQLEPIGDSFNLMEDAEVKLETIHRNANEIARFAGFLRDGNEARNWKSQEKLRQRKVYLTPTDKMLKSDSWGIFDQVITAFNKDRVILNQHYRDFLHNIQDEDNVPIVGDRVICLRNNHKRGLANGMIGVVKRVDSDTCYMVFETTNGVCHGVEYDPEQFNNPKSPEFTRKHEAFDFAYCITCHKAQGSEFGHVLVMPGECPYWSRERWAYTAASRAKSKLTWMI